jgi:hypothetical protein
MNVNERIISQHVEYEPQAYMYAFTIELEISAAAMWCFAIHFKPNVSKCLKSNQSCSPSPISIGTSIENISLLIRNVWMMRADFSELRHS